MSALSLLKSFYSACFQVPLSGAALAGVEQMLANSANVTAIMQQWADQAVTNLYTSISERAPDPKGLASFANALMSGTSLSVLRRDFVYGQVVTQDLKNAYLACYGEQISSTALTTAQIEMENGQTRAQVEAGWQQAASLAAKQMFINAVGISPDAPTVSSITNLILQANKMGTISNVIAKSPVVTNALNNLYLAANGTLPTKTQSAAFIAAVAKGATIATVAGPEILSLENTLESRFSNIFGQPASNTTISTLIADVEVGTDVSALTTLVTTTDQAQSIIESTFTQIVGKTISQSALASAEQLLANGTTFAELKTAWATAAAENLYYSILNRAPDIGGLTSLVSGLINGLSYTTAFKNFATGNGAASSLESTYQAFYGTPMTSQQLSGFVAQLESGVTLAAIEAPWTGGAASVEDQTLERSYSNATGGIISQQQLSAAENAIANGTPLYLAEAGWYSFSTATAQTPIIWYAPESNPTNPVPTSDFMNLFMSQDPSWTSDASVYKISTQFALNAPAAELSAMFSYLAAHHIALAMEGLMLTLTPGSSVGQGVDGYMAPGEIGKAAQRIASLGGNLQYVAMDSPLVNAHQFSGGNHPQMSITAAAQMVAASISEIESVFPNVQVGDIEPTIGVNDLAQWFQAFQDATGKPLAFFDADTNWNASPDYLGALEQTAAIVRSAGIQFGVIINGDGTETSSDAWINTAEGRLAAIEADPLIRPAQLVIQTWDSMYPTEAVPAGNTGSLMNLLASSTVVSSIYSNSQMTSEATDTININGPSQFQAVVGLKDLLSGLNVSASATSAIDVGIVVAATGGMLAISDTSGCNTIESSGQTIAFSGDLAAINQELATLSVTESTAGTDNIALSVYEGLQNPYSVELTVSSSLGSSGSSSSSPITSLQIIHEATYQVPVLNGHF